jgi:hypothetical protein
LITVLKDLLGLGLDLWISLGFSNFGVVIYSLPVKPSHNVVESTPKNVVEWLHSKKIEKSH